MSTRPFKESYLETVRADVIAVRMDPEPALRVVTPNLQFNSEVVSEVTCRVMTDFSIVRMLTYQYKGHLGTTEDQGPILNTRKVRLGSPLCILRSSNNKAYSGTKFVMIIKEGCAKGFKQLTTTARVQFLVQTNKPPKKRISQNPKSAAVGGALKPSTRHEPLSHMVRVLVHLFKRLQVPPTGFLP